MLATVKTKWGGGFYRSKTIEHPTNVTIDLYRVCLEIFHKHYEGKTVRKISMSLSHIVDDADFQLNLFDPNGWKKHELGYTVDKIRNRYGSDALLRAVSYTSAGTARHRAKLIGGHKR